MKLIIPKIRYGERLFFLGYGMFLFFSILSTSFYAVYFAGAYKYIQLFSVCIAFLPELAVKSRYKRSTAIILFSLAALVVLICLTASSYTQVVCALAFVYCGRRVELEKIFRFTLLVSGAAVCFIVASAYLGIIRNYVRVGNRIRRYCGFRYSLYGPAFVFNLTAIEVYLKKADITWKKILLLAAVNGWMFLETISRLSFYLSIALLLAAVVLKIKPDFLEKKKITCGALTLSFVVCFTVIICCTIKYDRSVPWMSMLNHIMGGRLALAKSSLVTHGVSLFGQDINWYGWGLDIYGNIGENLYTMYNYVDCLYIQILQRFGLCFLIAYLALHTAALRRAYKNRDFYLMIVLAFLAVHAVIDDLTLGLHYNTFWFAIGTALFGDAGSGDKRSGEKVKLG